MRSLNLYTFSLGAVLCFVVSMFLEGISWCVVWGIGLLLLIIGWFVWLKNRKKKSASSELKVNNDEK